ncbi:MAG: hypothetical protein HYX37_14765 [Rhizobiales bacterium]|nr:hypothetical protein [Hyphomicrobiales bacterium]
MKNKTVLPLPRYTRRKWLKGAQTWGYFFEPPTWARHPSEERGPCPVGAEELGTDYGAAVRRVEGVLLPALDTWRTGGATDPIRGAAPFGTLDWGLAIYRGTDKFRRLKKSVRALHERGFDLVGSYGLKDGRRLGSVRLSAIDTGVVDPLYEKLLRVPVKDKDGKPVLDTRGQPVMRERRTTVNHAMKSCRRAWNVARRLHPKDVPPENPFARMGLVESAGVVPEADYGELLEAVAAADGLGVASLGTALMVTFEWLQRQEHIFNAFELDHYRPKDRPNEVLIVHPKNGEAVWIPLFDKGLPLFPELMGRMDAMKRDRVGSLFFIRDWRDPIAKVPVPWATALGALDFVKKKTKEVIRAAGLRDELSFTSFRHGGLTELGDADLTDTQIRALSRQKSSKVLPRYIKRTRRQIVAGTVKRRALRKGDDAG